MPLPRWSTVNCDHYRKKDAQNNRRHDPNACLFALQMGKGIKKTGAPVSVGLRQRACSTCDCVTVWLSRYCNLSTSVMRLPHKYPLSLLQCDKSCGVGTQYREVVCIVRRGDRKIIIDDHQCEQDMRPETTQSCDSGPCQGLVWITSRWSGVSSDKFHIMLLIRQH